VLKIFAKLSISATAAFAMTIVGVGTGPNSAGVYYEINPVTGAVTMVATGNNWMPTSASGTPGAYFATSPINPYLVSYPSMAAILHCTFCPAQSTPWLTADTAYDFSTGRLFGIAIQAPGPNTTAMLANIGIGAEQDSGGQRFRPLSVSPIVPSLGGLSAIIEVVPGVGIFLTTGMVAYVIDPDTGAVLRSGNLTLAGGIPIQFLPPVTSLAFDPDTRRLIAATGSYAGGQTVQMIYRIDPTTFEVTVLNSDAPNLHGIAAINNYPEPATMLLVGVALIGLRVLRKSV
jgi:hypothetical protein